MVQNKFYRVLKYIREIVYIAFGVVATISLFRLAKLGDVLSKESIKEWIKVHISELSQMISQDGLERLETISQLFRT